MNIRGHDMILQDVTFAYGPHAEPVLRNLDLTVPYGDHLAIVGPSGIGKSTLAGLLCGLLRPDSGTVTIDGAVAADLAPAQLAEIRTLIPQEAYVFAATVWENLTYLCASATTRQVDNAVAAVGAESLIAKLGGMGAELFPASLSAGERQLIALVRAYISPAPVVVFDEATCHLDPAAERRAEDAFADRHGTLIVIAHRISSALRARRILVLDGVSAVAGDHLMLMSSSPLYRELLGHWNSEPAAVADPGGQLLTARSQLIRTLRSARTALPAVAEAFSSMEVPVGAVAGPSRRPAAIGTGTRAENGNGSMQDHALPQRHAGNSGPVLPDPAAVNGAAEPAVVEPAVVEPAVGEPGAGAPVIFGRVTQGGSSPLPGATVTLTDLSGRQLDRDTSDAGGHYRLRPPRGGSYLVICASAAHQPIAALVLVADQSVQHDIALSGTAASVSGCVHTAGSRRPIADAVVTMVNSSGDVVGVSSTEADGRFSFLELAQGHYTLTVAAPAQRPVAQSLEVPACGQVTHDVEVAVRTRLVGTVRTATAGAAVPEALATLIAPDGHVVASVLTDNDGAFVFGELDAGAYTVIATGYPPVATDVNLDAGVPGETVLTLRPPTLHDSAVGNGAAADGAVTNGAVTNGAVKRSSSDG